MHTSIQTIVSDISSSYGTRGGLEGPRGAADAVAVVSMVGGEAGWAG